jgi:glycosyltransferase involved in cell wall biosynthesis
MGHFVRKALADLGVESSGDIGNGTDGRGHATPDQPHFDNGALLDRVALWLSTPPHVRGWYEGQFAAILTMWESSRIPEGFRDNLADFDRIFVPSVQNQELYGRYHPDVRYVPLGVSPHWHPRTRKPVERDFVFLTAGYGERKGVKQVVEAFKRVFPMGLALGPGLPIPRLICKSGDDVAGLGITQINRILDGPEERELYANAHCFVSGSKGEGWGLMPLQAIAQGCPTILGNAHGHAAFSHLGIPLSTHAYRCEGATFWGDGGEWWEPDFDQMCEAMLAVYMDYDRYQIRAAQSAEIACREFTWTQTAEALIFGLSDQLFLPAPTERVWHPTKPRLFHIRVNKRVTYVINGIKYAFVPGEDYWESGDLKRQLMASGHLDLAVLDPDDLGREDSVVPAECRAQNAICPQCHNPYNREQTLQEIFADVQ